MKQAIRAVVAIAATLAPLTMAVAQEAEAGRRCAQVADSLQRLVCYDRVFQNAPAAKSAVAAPATVAVAPTAAVPATAAAPVAAAAPAAAATLGSETLRRSSRAKPSEESQLTATVTALRVVADGLARLTFDNGQVWEQMESSSLFTVAVGDTLQIERTRMGGYRMSRADKVSGWVRTTRLQ